MNKTNRTLGDSFYFRGLCVLLIILFHTIELFDGKVYALSKPLFFASLYKESINAALFIASGTGFTKKEIKKCFRQQSKYFFVPYILTALATVVIHLIVHYLSFRWFPGSLSESLKLLGGFALGLGCTYSANEITLYSCGPVWFLLTLFVSWNILNVIVNKTDEKKQPIFVVCIAIIGSIICRFTNFALFCIPQSMIAVAYLYLGYCVRNKDCVVSFFINKYEPMLLIISNVIIVISGICYKNFDSLSGMYFNLGIVSIASQAICGLFIYKSLMNIKPNTSKVINKWISNYGLNSRDIICFHTIEFHAALWYLTANRFERKPLLGIIVIFVFRLTIIFVFNIIIKLYKKYRRKIKQRAN